MKIKTVLLSMLFASLGNAQWTGRWQGEGVLKSSRGQNQKCSYIKVQLVQQEDFLTFKEVSYKCGIIFSDWEQGRLKVVGQDLLNQDNEVVGLLTDTTLELFASGTMNDPFKLVKTANGESLDFFLFRGEWIGDNVSSGNLAQSALVSRSFYSNYSFLSRLGGSGTFSKELRPRVDHIKKWS